MYELTGAVVVLVILAISLVVGAKILTGVSDATIDYTGAQTNNESMGTVLVNISESITGAGQNPSAYSVVEVLNATQFKVEASSYTFATGNPTASFTLTNMSHNNTVLRITYTYQRATYGEAYNLSMDAQDALASTGPWLPIIVLIVIAGFVIGYLITRFTKGTYNPS